MGQSRSLHASAFRRNMAEHLGFGSANNIYNKVIRLSDEQRAAVRAWLEGCQLAWITTASAPAAKLLEDDLKTEWLHPLTKR